MIIPNYFWLNQILQLPQIDQLTTKGTSSGEIYPIHFDSKEAKNHYPKHLQSHKISKYSDSRALIS